MSGGGGTNTVEKADPWAPAQPYLEYGLGQAHNLYQQNPSSYYPGQTYLPMNEFQQAGIYNQLGNVSDLQNISAGTQGSLGDLLNAPNLSSNPYAQQWSNALTQNLGGNIENTMGQLGRGFQNYGENLGFQNQNLINQQARGLAATGDQYSNQLADMIGQQQRAYDVGANRLYENLTEQALPSIASQAAGLGQTGSSRQGVAEGIALKGFGQSLSDVLRANAENLGSSSRSALTGIGNLARTGQETIGQNVQGGILGLNQAGREAMGQLGETGRSLGNQANLALSDFMSNQYGQGLDTARGALALAPTVAAMSQMPYQSLQDVGNMIQQQDYLPLQEAITRWNYNQQAPWNDLQNYTGMITGAGGLGSSGMSTTDAAGNPIGGAIGGGLTGYALGSAIGGAGGAAGGAATGSSFGPYGALAGALLGAMMSR